MNMRKQSGVSLLGLLVICFVLVFVALLGMKVTPAYIEYFSIKKAIAGMAQGGELRSGSVSEVRAAFDRRATIDSIEVVAGRDLDVIKDGGEIVVSYAYTKKIPLFSNISLLIEFAGSSAKLN
jgi:hypothetical protein